MSHHIGPYRTDEQGQTVEVTDPIDPNLNGYSPNGKRWGVRFTNRGKLKVTKDEEPDPIIDYGNRNKDRQATIEEATISMVAYFMGLGDTKEDADSKITQISREVKGEIFGYILGDVQQLKDHLQQISTLAFFDQDAKDTLIGML